MDAADIDGLLLRNCEARQAHWRATEDSRKAAGFLVGLCVVVVYSCAFVVSMLCACENPGACGFCPAGGALVAHAVGWHPPAGACLK